jgi:hypothetical protein
MISAKKSYLQLGGITIQVEIWIDKGKSMRRVGAEPVGFLMANPPQFLGPALHHWEIKMRQVIPQPSHLTLVKVSDSGRAIKEKALKFCPKLKPALNPCAHSYLQAFMAAWATLVERAKLHAGSITGQT